MEEDWLPMLDELYTALLQHKQTSKDEWVFTDPQTGGPYRCRQHWMGRLCSKARVRPFGLHAIRHLTASILANEGVPLIIIQAILRHKSMHVTQRYLHQTKELRSTLQVLSKRKSLLAEPSASTRRQAQLHVVN
jgi:integrase